MNILEVIAARTKERVEEEKRARPLAEVRREAERLAAAMGNSGGKAGDGSGRLPFEAALAREGPNPDMAFICEVKRASPTKGMIAPKFPYLEIAREYEEAGAAAVSCLTEPYWFKGSSRYLQEIAQAVRLPVLRKDFVVDDYMIYEARGLGASAVLLICAILEPKQLRAYLQLCRELGLSALVEVRTEAEAAEAAEAEARVIGVNNRDLRTFEVDLETSLRLRRLVPPEILFVSESGIRNAGDIRRLQEAGTDAVLIGETLMRAADKKGMLEELRAGALRREPAWQR